MASAHHIRRPACGFALALAIAAGALGARPAGADEQPKVVLLNFAGHRADDLRKAVIPIFKRGATVAARRVFTRAQDRLDARGLDDDSVVRVARATGIDGVVSGVIRRKKGRYYLLLEVRTGTDGSVVGDVEVRLGRRGELTDSGAQQVAEELLPAVESLPRVSEEPSPAADTSPNAGAAGDPGSDAGRQPADSSRDPDRQPADPARVAGRDPSDRAGDPDTARDSNPTRTGRAARTGPGPGTRSTDLALHRSRGSGGSELTGQSATARAASANSDESGPVGLELVAGVTAVRRSLSFGVRAGATDPYGYLGIIPPTAHVSGQIFPLALAGSRGALAGLGIDFEVEAGLNFNSRLDGIAVDLPTRHWRWRAGALYQAVFGRLSAALGAGYGAISFNVEFPEVLSETGPYLPSVMYTHADAQLGLGVRVTRRLSIAAAGRYLHIFDSGEIQSANSYGNANGNGVDAELALETRLTSSWVLRASSRFTRIGLTFTDGGAMSDTNRDGQADVLNAIDQYLGAAVSAGVRF